jgi:Zn-finger nucleic acid-binding protein
MQLNPDRGCFVCPYCAGEWVPEANFEGVRVMGPSDADCPLCKTKLSQARLLSYGLLYCEVCQGTLVPMDDLVPLTDDLRASRNTPSYVGRPPDPKDLDRRILCPTCHQTMDAHPYGGPGNVNIDTCETCSVHWLDRGELRRIALAPDHHYVV